MYTVDVHLMCMAYGINHTLVHVLQFEQMAEELSTTPLMKGHPPLPPGRGHVPLHPSVIRNLRLPLLDENKYPILPLDRGHAPLPLDSGALSLDRGHVPLPLDRDPLHHRNLHREGECIQCTCTIPTRCVHVHQLASMCTVVLTVTSLWIFHLSVCLCPMGGQWKSWMFTVTQEQFFIMQSYSWKLRVHLLADICTFRTYSTDLMQLNPHVHASFKSLANEMRVVHSLDTPTRSSARRAWGREASAASCLVLILLKALNAAWKLPY